MQKPTARLIKCCAIYSPRSDTLMWWKNTIRSLSGMSNKPSDQVSAILGIELKPYQKEMFDRLISKQVGMPFTFVRSRQTSARAELEFMLRGFYLPHAETAAVKENFEDLTESEISAVLFFAGVTHHLEEGRIVFAPAGIKRHGGKWIVATKEG